MCVHAPNPAIFHISIGRRPQLVVAWHQLKMDLRVNTTHVFSSHRTQDYDDEQWFMEHGNHKEHVCSLQIPRCSARFSVLLRTKL